MTELRFDFEERIPNRLRAIQSAGIPGPKTLMVVRITGEQGGTWTIDLRDAFEVTEGATEGADCTLEMTPATWAALSANPGLMTSQYAKGDIRCTGSPVHGLKIKALLE